jgi:hypothetical protein
MTALTAAPGASPRLAAAFLALSDAGTHAAPERRFSPAVALAALAASVVLAFSAPLAWISGPVVRPSDLPPATQAAKASVPAPDDDAGDG